MRFYSSFTAALLLLLLLFSSSIASAVTTIIAPGELLCLKESVPPQTSIAFQFEVVSHGAREISAALIDQDGKALTNWEMVSEGEHLVRARDNVKIMKACFDNRRSYYKDRVVSFNFRHHVDYEGVATQHELDPVERKVDELSSTMMKMESLQMTLRQQQKEHRATVEVASERLLLWSLFQVGSLIVMSLFQIYFLKRLLERKSFV